MTVDFVAHLVGSKSEQAKVQMPAHDTRVTICLTSSEANGGEVPDRLKLTLGSI